MSGSYLCPGIPIKETVQPPYLQNIIIMFCLPIPTLIQYLWEIYIFRVVDQSWEYVSRSQTHECRNWDWGREIPRKGIHKRDFRCSVGKGTGGGGGGRADLTKLRLRGWCDVNIRTNLWVLFIHLANHRIGERNWRESSTLSWRSLWIETSTGVPDTMD